MTSGHSPDGSGGLTWPPLIAGRLIRRYKRFLADVLLNDGRTVTAHCPNSGAMLACSEPGRPVRLSRSDDPRRKHPYTWELIHMPDSLVGVNTQVPNKLVAEAIRAGCIDALTEYNGIRTEVKTGDHARLDLMLTGEGRPDAYVEVKNCTLVKHGTASFPDAVTVRGRKHLGELMRLRQADFRAVLFFLVQRMDAHRFLPADAIDPEYGRDLRRAMNAGVEVLVYDVSLDGHGIRMRSPLPILLAG